MITMSSNKINQDGSILNLFNTLNNDFILFFIN